MDLEKSAQRWRDLLRNEAISPEDRIALEYGTIEDITRIVERLEIEADAVELLKAREDAKTLDEAARADKPKPTEKQDNQTRRRSSHRTETRHLPTYEEFKKQSSKEAQEAADKWSKKPDFTIARSRQIAYLAALKTEHNKFAKLYPALAKEWAQKHNDKNLASAAGIPQPAIKPRIAVAKPLPTNPIALPTQEVEQKPQLRTRFGQVERAGQTIPTGDQNWGVSEPIEYSAAIKQPKKQDQTEEVFIPVQEPGQQTVITEQRPSPALSQTRAGGYPNRRRGGFLNRANRLAGRARGARRSAGIASSAAGAVKNLRRARTIASVLSFIWPAVLIVLIFIFLVTIILGAGCFIVNNPIGDAIGINYCQSLTNPAPPPPNPGPGKPKIITFTGGYAYLSCSETEPVNCPKLNKGDKVTAYAIIHIDNNFPQSIDKKNATLSIGTFLSVFFNIDDANIKPAPNSKGFFSLGWKYTWNLENIIGKAKTIGTGTYEIAIPLTALADDGEAFVTLDLKGFETTGGGADNLYEGMDSAPTNNKCESRNWPSPNFGDPVCSYSFGNWDEVLRLTETKHPEFIPFWKDIARTEGNVNTIGGGAYGKFQMNSTNPPFKQSNLDNEFRGDVPWQRQIQNAVTRNNNLIKSRNTFGFWGTAMCLCWFNYYRDGSKGWCNDIIKTHQVRCPSKCTGGKRCSGPTDNVGSERESIDCKSPKMKQCSPAPGVNY